jgi:ABC-2 type transport system permease protein
MKTLFALLKLEYWEHRGAFLKTPIIIGIVMGILALLGYFTTDRFIIDVSGGDNLQLAIGSLQQLGDDKINLALDVFMLMTGSLYHLVLFIIVFFFLLGSLYDDRKDGSILFYKSLPVSDTQTVLSKMLTATLVAPAAFVIGIIISHLIVFTIISLILLLNGINPFTLLWFNAALIENWGAFIVGCLVQALWALPLYGWLLFASSVAKRRPFLLAVFAPLLAGFIWYWYNALVNLNLFKVGFFQTIGVLFAKATTPFGTGIGSRTLENIDFDPTAHTTSEVITSMYNGLLQVELLYGIAFAAVTTGLAIYIRRYRNTI